MFKTFFIFRRQRNIVFLGSEITAMRPYNNCVCLKKTCWIDENSEKCIECIWLGWICNLTFLNVIKYRRLNAEKKSVRTILRCLIEKQSHLFKYLDQIKEKQQKMMKNKKKNIHELQWNDVFFEILNPLISISFEQIVLNDLIVNKKYFNSFFFVENIDEVFFDNI